MTVRKVLEFRRGSLTPKKFCKNLPPRFACFQGTGPKTRNFRGTKKIGVYLGYTLFRTPGTMITLVASSNSDYVVKKFGKHQFIIICIYYVIYERTCFIIN